MSIQNFPSALQPIIQQGFLEREFHSGLTSNLGFRAIADKEEFPIRIGESLTKTRAGLKAPVTVPLNPANNTNLDNGLTPSSFAVEQYTMTLNEYADTIDLNIINDKVGLASQFLQNSKVNGIQAAQSIDRIARNSLYGAYLGGNTRVRTTLGSAGATISVDDIRGFLQVMVNGQLVSVSGTSTLNVTVGSNVYALTGVAADGSNVSTAPNGVSGTLTFSTNVTVSDGTAGNAAVSVVAPTILRPNARASTATLTTSDFLTMSLVLDAVATLRSNAVPTIDGLYNCYLDDRAARQLFSDPDFKLLYQGQSASKEFAYARVVELLDVRFIPTNEAPQQTLGGVKVHRAIICGKGALVEGTFAGMRDALQQKGSSMIEVVNSVAQITRPPLDRLDQIIAQSWYWIGGYAVPSDQTANTNIIPTSNNSYYKRAVVLEVGGS